MTVDTAIFVLKSLEAQLAGAGVSPDEEYDDIQIIANAVRLTRGSKTLHIPMAEVSLLGEWHKQQTS